MKQKYGVLWEVNPYEGEKTKGLYLGYGVPKPKGRYVHPLRTLERDSNGDFFDSVRYFKIDDENDYVYNNQNQGDYK